ncbi:MAG TPA: hypothetical protein VEH84_12355, partial [Alphaproteobacteria bacterium]|nr:hypothetical protein [Alphaproteobacteria bacterium]
ILPFKTLLSPYILRLTGDLVFLCIAQTVHGERRTQEFLEGTLFVFHDPNIWRFDALPIVRELQEKLFSYRAVTVPESLDAFVKDQVSITIRRLRILSSFNAEFSLSRTGTTALSVSDPPIISSNAPKLPIDVRRREQVVHVLAAQLFYFLRDMGHTHQHHDRRTDTIVDLHHVKNRSDLDWRLATLYSMYRKVIDLKRTAHSDAFSNALGIIAYAESFYLICEEELLDADKANLPKYYSSQIKDSIMAKKDALEIRANEGVRRRSGRSTFLLAVAGIILSFLALLELSEAKPKVTTHPALLTAAGYFLEHPIQTLAAAGVLYCAVAFYPTVGDPMSFKYFRAVFRLFHFLDRYTMAYIFLGFAIVFLGAAFYLYLDVILR